MARYRMDQHPVWGSHILPLLYVNGRRPRRRIEGRDPDDDRLRHLLLDLTIPCANCGRWMHPIRERNSKEWSRGFYLVVSCEEARCSRGSKAKEEVERLQSLIKGWTDPRQPELFE